MIAKLIAHGKDRETSIARMQDLILQDEKFCKQAMDIHYLEKHLLKQITGNEEEKA
ncbi:Uncharacterised protein [Mycobacteroides abscessus subsp. abscessus]|nr:Uncharacterised protein [Mycobacteroides abscessus subsp. abscessus]